MVMERPKMGRPIDLELRESIIFAHLQHPEWSIRQIAKHLQCGRETVRVVLQDIKAT